MNNDVKFLSGIDMLLPNRHKELDEFWTKHSKVLKNLQCNGLLLTKVYNN